MFKETPLLSAITVLEVMNEAKIVANTDYRYLEPMTLVGALFLAISLIAITGVRLLEKRYSQPLQ
jgi:polar amino acid transport system permease protein